MNHSNDINDMKSSHSGWPPAQSESSVNVPSHSYSEVILIIISALIGLILTEFFHADMADNLITASHVSLHFPGAPGLLPPQATPLSQDFAQDPGTNMPSVEIITAAAAMSRGWTRAF